MAHSFAKASSLPSGVLPAGRYDHRLSQRTYEVVRRQSADWLIRRSEAGDVERRIDFVVGSGAHARSFLTNPGLTRSAQGRLMELPLSWYAAGGGYYAMSPGYDRRDHQDFRREVSPECLFCHSNDGERPISCDRCHGQGDPHKRNLTAKQTFEICLQCHLQTTSQRLPHALRRYGRAMFSYLPGEPLSDYMLHFDDDRPDKFEVNGSAYRLMQSACFTRSNGKLTCITCHDPHGGERDVDAACRSCHTGTHANNNNGCAACHMPKRRSDDAVHVVVTDHRIARNRPTRSLLLPIPERQTSGSMSRLFYPQDAPDADLYLAVARGNAEELAAAIERRRPPQAEFYYELGIAYARAGSHAKAIPQFEAALRRKREYPRARRALGEAQLRTGNIKAAIQTLQPLQNDAEALNVLGVAYGQANRIADSVRALQRAVRMNPDLPLAWRNLGFSLEQAGDARAAAGAYREARRLQPDRVSE